MSSSVWTFVSKPGNQKLLSWLGGGAVVAATGIWAVVTYVWPADDTPESRMRAAGRQSRRQRLRLDEITNTTSGTVTASPCVETPKNSRRSVRQPFSSPDSRRPWRHHHAPAVAESQSVVESIVIGGSVSNSTITNTVNHENPATLALLTKVLADKDASEEKRRQAEAKVAELSTKLGFTSAAVAEFFKIFGEQNVPDEKIPARLIEVATHFAQTRDALAALEPDDPKAAALAASAKQALDGGRLAEADRLLDQAKEIELAALRQAREFTAESPAGRRSPRAECGETGLRTRQYCADATALSGCGRNTSRRPRSWFRRAFRTRWRAIFTAKPMRFIEKVTNEATTRR